MRGALADIKPIRTRRSVGKTTRPGLTTTAKWDRGTNDPRYQPTAPNSERERKLKRD